MCLLFRMSNRVLDHYRITVEKKGRSTDSFRGN